MKVQNELFDGLRFKFMINFIAISSVVNFKVLVIKNDDFINFQNLKTLNQVFIYHYQASYLILGLMEQVIHYFRKLTTEAFD